MKRWRPGMPWIRPLSPATSEYSHARPGAKSLAASLACRFHDTDYLIFQTAGPDGVFGLVAAKPKGVNADGEAGAKQAVFRTMERYAREASSFSSMVSDDLLSEAQRQSFQERFGTPPGRAWRGMVFDAQKRGKLYHIRLREPALAARNKWGLTEGIVSEQEVALLFRKALHRGQVTVPESARSEWLPEAKNDRAQ